MQPRRESCGLAQAGTRKRALRPLVLGGKARYCRQELRDRSCYSVFGVATSPSVFPLLST